MSWGVPRIEKSAEVIVACLEDWPEDSAAAGFVFPLLEQLPGPRTFCIDGCSFGVADVGGHAAVDIRVIDLARNDKKNVRWRDVQKLCRNRGIDTVPITYQGRFDEAPGDLLDRAPYCVMRLEARGPWMVFRRPVRGGSTQITDTASVILDGIDLED